MSRYVIQKSLKTRFLNFFRRMLTFPPIEKFIASNSTRKHSLFWSRVYPMDYLYPQGSVRTAERDGIRFSLDISHVVDNYLYFSPPERPFQPVKKFVTDSQVIFDIGANIGSTAMQLAQLSPNAKIYAFEPHPRTFERARLNLGLNDFRNIDLQKIGLGAKEESLRLYEVNQNNPGMNRIIGTLTSEQDYPYVEISISTLDQFVLSHKIERLDFVKIDVEGFEFSVLRGGEKTLSRCRPTLFLELDDANLRDNHSSASQLVELLLSYGYSEIYRADTMASLTASTDFARCHYDVIAR